MLGIVEPARPLPYNRGRPRPMKRYQIQFELGSGAMAKVYAAHDVDMDREVALKVLRESAAANENVRQRFLREARISAGLSHPNLVTVHDAGEEDGQLYLVMELVEGDSLAHVLDRKDFQLKDVVVVLEAAARGVHHAHEKGAVHRDLKPANILIPKKGPPKVADFGLAHLMQADSLLTRSGTQLGTPVYMAPEQARGANNQITARTDVYALGAILYEACTGRPPFDGKSVVEIYRKIVNSPVLPPRRLKPGLPEALDRICLKALEKDPALRYASAQEFADDLRSWINGKEVRVRRASFGARVGSSLRLHPATWIVTILVASVLAVGGAIVLAVARRSAPAEPGTTPEAAATPAPRRGPDFAKIRDATLPAFRDLEAGYLGDPARLGAPSRVSEIEKSAGDHPAGRAWAALARHLAGRPTGRADLEAAARDSGDDPWPWLLLALASFEDWARSAELTISYGPSGVSMAATPVDDAMAKSLEAALVALDRATARAGTEPSVRTFRKFAEALSLAARKEYADAGTRASEGGTDPLLSLLSPYVRAYLLTWDRRFDEAERVLEPVLSRGWPRASHVAGVARMSQGVLAQVAGQDGSPHLKAAVDRLQKSSELAPDYLGSYQYRAVARLWLGNVEGSQGRDPFVHWDAGVKDLDVLLQKNPGALGSWNSRGNLHRYKADGLANRKQDPVAAYDLAIRDYSKAIELGHREGGPFHSRAWCLQQKGTWLWQNRQDPLALFVQACKDLDEAGKRQPQSLDIALQRGKLRVTVAQLWAPRQDAQKALPQILGDAVDDFTKVLALQPGHLEALTSRARLYQESGDLAGAAPGALDLYDAAVKDYSAAIAQRPDYAVIHAERANCYQRIANRDAKSAERDALLKKAWDGFDQALQLDPAYWNAMTGKGTLCEAAGRFDEAIQWFERAKVAGKDDPNCQKWCQARLDALRQRGKPSQ